MSAGHSKLVVRVILRGLICCKSVLLISATPFMEKAYQGEDSNPSCPAPVDDSADTTNAPPTVYATGYENYTTTAPYEIGLYAHLLHSYHRVDCFSGLPNQISLS